MIIHAIVGCGTGKQPHPARADLMYLGGYHRAMLTAARRAFPDPSIKILSAKYGLLDLAQIIEPYDVSFGDPVWVFAGSRYVSAVQGFTPARQVFGGGMGQQLRLANLFDPASLKATPKS